VVDLEKNDSHYLRELIRTIIRYLGILEKGEASCCGATISQCHAIVEIGRSEEISLNDLAELLNLDKSTMSRTVNNLVDQNFVVRDTHSEDRRYVKIKLTEEGSKVFKTTENSMEAYYKRIMNSIPEDKREQVLESLKLLHKAVKENKCC
jgi:DNA-binding MarR family transcriptional regulator